MIQIQCPEGMAPNVTEDLKILYIAVITTLFSRGVDPNVVEGEGFNVDPNVVEEKDLTWILTWLKGKI